MNKPRKKNLKKYAYFAEKIIWGQQKNQDFAQKIVKNHITINKIMFQNLLST